MGKIERRQHSAAYKAKVAIEAAKGQRTVPEIAKQYTVHPSQVFAWKKILMDRLPELYADGRAGPDRTDEELVASLYQQIGQLQV